MHPNISLKEQLAPSLSRVSISGGSSSGTQGSNTNVKIQGMRNNPSAEDFSEESESRAQINLDERGFTDEKAARPFLNVLNDVLRVHPGPSPAIRNGIDGPWEGDLSNAIHPIFGRDKWSVKSNMRRNDVLWTRLQPALKLATRYITSDELQGFWIWLHFGPLESLKNSKKNKRIKLPGGNFKTPTSIRKVTTMFANMAQSIRWQFATLPDAHGSTQFNPRKNGKHMHDIRLDFNFRRFLMRRGYHADRHIVRRIQTNWLLANTFVHELAHAFYHAKTGKNLEEPFFEVDHYDTDLGWAWERWMWGPGRIYGTDSPTGGIETLYWRPEVCYPLSPSIRSQYTIVYDVDVRWLHEHFLEKTWDRLDALPVAKKTLWDPPKARVAVLQGPSFRNLNQQGWYWIPEDCDCINWETIRFTPARGTAL